MTQQNKKKGYDYSLLAVVFLLVIIGLVILYSTSAYNGQVKFDDQFYYLKKQAFATALGLVLMFFMANIDYHILQKFAVPAYFVALLLSIAVLLVGDEYNGSKRWLSFGPLSFQPSEFAKIAVILFLACVITKNVRKMKKMRYLLFVMLLILPIVGLVGASNLSTAIIILGIGAVLVFVASPKYAQFVWLCVSGAGFMGIFWHLRVTGWSVWQSGEIRKNMRKDTRHCKDCLRLVPAGFSEEDLGRVCKNWDLCRRHRMT